MPRLMASSTFLKRVPRGRGKDRGRQEDRACPHRDRSTRPGSARRTRSRGDGRGAGPDRRPRTTNAPRRPTSSARSVRSSARGRLRAAPLQHRRNEPAPGRDRAGGGAQSACTPPRRPGWLAHVRQARRAAQCHTRAVAAEVSGTEPGRKYLAVPARQLAVEFCVFTSYGNIVDHCCDTWNKLIAQPWHIMSIGLRDWAHRF